MSLSMCVRAANLVLPFIVTVTAACGGTVASSSTDETTPPIESTTARTPTDEEPVLRLGRELAFPRFRLLTDGTVRDDDHVFGRVDADGTLRRADGSACLRVDRSGAIAIVPPSRARDDHGISFRIDGDWLLLTENGRTERILEAVDGELVLELEHNPIVGLTPEYHRTALAVHALYFMLLLAE